MRFTEAKEEIVNSWREILQNQLPEAKEKANKETSYICPFCGHGTNGDGLTFMPIPKSEDGNTLICFHCKFKGDVIDLWRKMYGKEYEEAVYELASVIGITIDEDTEKTYRTATQTRHDKGESNIKMPIEKKPLERAVNSATNDFTEYYKECAERVHDQRAISYLNGRGISEATISAYNIGFDPECDPARSGIKQPRIVIPVSKSFYVARSIDPNINKRFKAMNPKGSNIEIFNLEAAYQEKVVFITEGIFDALSIIETGKKAIALNSASNTDILIGKFEKKRPSAVFVLCLDNDSAGDNGIDYLRKGLNRLNISFIVADVCCGYKDPNEALLNATDKFLEAVYEAERQTSAKPDLTADYLEKFFDSDVSNFKEAIKTGFDNLDNKTSGLYPGLYCIAAISSLGKTTFVHQIADNMAEAGNDVLYFSLEQSRFELVSKSIARQTYKDNPRSAVDSLSIRKGFKPYEVKKATAEYKEGAAKNLSIIEGNFNCDVSFIGNYIRKYCRENNTKPIIFIDYLQILQPEAEDTNRGKREAVDTTITELKRISRENELTILVIASVNRNNYLMPVDFESIKESGGIEYTCDCVWGLQLECMNETIFDKKECVKEKRERVKEAKAEDPRQIELVCLKNRYGIANFSCYFNYYPRYDYFEANDGGVKERYKNNKIL